MLAAAALLLCSASPLRAQPAPATRPARRTAATRPASAVPNPHWTLTECRQCHEMRGSEALPIPASQVDRNCLRCHDGRLAPAEKHPVGRPIPTATAALPEGWPAPDGRMSCLTCHDLTPTAGHTKGAAPMQRGDFLRGGPPQGLLVFCSKCHTSNTQETRYNPHRQLGPDGRIQEDGCRFCHVRAFKPEEFTRRTGQPALKGGGLMLCIGCHTQHVDYFEPGHIGREAPDWMVAHLVSRARAAGGLPAVSDESQPARTAGPPVTRLPLGPDNMVVCSTCHNPHQAGVFPAGSLLSIGAIPVREQKGTAATVRLGSSLCGECHGK